jgi:hypothetical protein
MNFLTFRFVMNVPLLVNFWTRLLFTSGSDMGRQEEDDDGSEYYIFESALSLTTGPVGSSYNVLPFVISKVVYNLAFFT